MNDGKPSNQRPTKSLTLLVAEQQAVRGFVHERRELRVGAAHRARTRATHTNQLSSQHRGDDDADGLRVERGPRRTRCARSGCGAARSRNSGAGRALAVSRSVGSELGERARARAASSRRSRTHVTLSDRCSNNVRPDDRSRLLDGRCRPVADRQPAARACSPPRMPARRLVQWCGLFGVAEGTARVALEPDGRAGRARARATGRTSSPGRLRRRQARRTGASRPSSSRGTGEWLLGVGRARRSAAADERAALRDAMRRLRHRRAARGRVDPARQPAPRVGARATSWAIGRRAVPVVDGAARRRRASTLATRAVRPDAAGRRGPRLLRPHWSTATPRPPATASGDRRRVRGRRGRARARARAIRCCRPSCAPRDWPGDALRAGLPRVRGRLLRRGRRLVPRAVT